MLGQPARSLSSPRTSLIGHERDACTLALPNPGGDPQLKSLHQYASCYFGCASAANRIVSGIATVRDCPSAPFAPDKPYHLWCDGACPSSLGNWHDRDLGFPAYCGGAVDLVLDQAGQPHMSFDALAKGPGRGWCTGDCRSGGGTWQRRSIRTDIQSVRSVAARQPQ